MQESELIAKTFMDLERVLVKELTQLGANNVQIGRRTVSFMGSKETMYRANFQLHIAIRILKPVAHFKAKSAEGMYEGIVKIDRSKHILPGKAFSVDSIVYSEGFTNSRFATYKVKDAIVDQFHERAGTRPNISISDPGIRLNIHAAEDNATLSLDSGGGSLHRRGCRQESVEAPLNEVLATGMILITGRKGETDSIDPMCGLGTLPIEVAFIVLNTSPGVFHKEFAFEKWPNFDQKPFDTIYNNGSQEREFTRHIYGCDIEMKAINTARMNITAAGLSGHVTIEQQDFKDSTQPKKKSMIMMNPPYDERISTPNLFGTYKVIGERLKHRFMGSEAWVLPCYEECLRQIRLKPSIKIPIYNDSLECEFRRYQMSDGKASDFRHESGIVKIEDEGRETAQKHRFKKEREFKKRLDENEEDAEADIRSFTFHSLERNKFGGGKSREDHERRPRSYRDVEGRKCSFRRGDGDRKRSFRRDDDRKRSSSRDDDRKFGGRRFDKSNKRGGLRGKNIYNHED